MKRNLSKKVLDKLSISSTYNIYYLFINNKIIYKQIIYTWFYCRSSADSQKYILFILTYILLKKF